MFFLGHNDSVERESCVADFGSNITLSNQIISLKSKKQKHNIQSAVLVLGIYNFGVEMTSAI